MTVAGRSPLLKPFIDSTMATLDWPARLGMLGPALPPWVPWQPAQALDSMAGVGGAASACRHRQDGSGQRPLHSFYPHTHLLLLREKTNCSTSFCYLLHYCFVTLM